MGRGMPGATFTAAAFNLTDLKGFKIVSEFGYHIIQLVVDKQGI